MIIFDLDGCLADCEHRGHFVEPEKNIIVRLDDNNVDLREGWKPDYESFYEACDKDEPIEATIKIFMELWRLDEKKIQIWSGRSNAVRDLTMKWLRKNINGGISYDILKMRPIGDSTPDDKLKETWLDEYMFGEKCELPLLKYAVPCLYYQKNPIECVFDDRPKVVRMWRRRGIFVFNCCQHDGDF